MAKRITMKVRIVSTGHFKRVFERKFEVAVTWKIGSWFSRLAGGKPNRFFKHNVHSLSSSQPDDMRQAEFTKASNVYSGPASSVTFNGNCSLRFLLGVEGENKIHSLLLFLCSDAHGYPLACALENLKKRIPLGPMLLLSTPSHSPLGLLRLGRPKESVHLSGFSSGRL